MKNKKTIITVTSIVAVLLVIVGVTYAYWLVTKTQTNQNIISSGCLDISLTGEKNDIELQDQFPLSDEDGMKLTPYEFTVTNNCTTSVDYQVNLESIGDSTNAIKASAIKVALNEEIKLLTAGGNAEPTVSGAYESHSIAAGRLAAASTTSEEDSATYELRIWIDANAPISEQNKTFTSKISVTIGQGIEIPYEKGTLAFDILSNYGGDSSITTLDTKLTEGEYGAETYLYMSAGTTDNKYSYYWGTELLFNDDNGTYKLGGTIVQATVEECRNGQKSDGTSIACSYTLNNRVNPNATSVTGYKVVSLTNSTYADTAYGNYITVQKTGTTTNNNFKVTTPNDAELHKAIDDLGTSYYFRGAPSNNYVKFGEWSDDLVVYRGYNSASNTNYFKEYATLGECTSASSYNINCSEFKYANEGDPMYWRIVRINGDGTIRMIYDGTAAVANGTSHTAIIGTTTYSSKSTMSITKTDDKYVGYTYDDGSGTQVDSVVKGVIDVWYDKHLETIYGGYIADGIFCNDREVESYIYRDSSMNETTDFNVATTIKLNYEASMRIDAGSVPPLTCSREEDKYTISDTTGNGLLSNPVGLVRAGELIMGGLSKSDNAAGSNNYLYSGEYYWTSTALDFSSTTIAIRYFNGVSGNVNGPGYVDAPYVGARPVINLKYDLEFTGKGTIDSPYEIIMN